MGLVFLGCFPEPMATQQGCPFLCQFLPIAAASCQPNKKKTLTQGLWAWALVIPKGGCSPKRWRWSGFKLCMETVTVSPRMGTFHAPSSPLEMARNSWGMQV